MLRLPYLGIIFHAQFLDSLSDRLTESLLYYFMGSSIIHLVKENAKIHVMEMRVDDFCLEYAWSI